VGTSVGGFFSTLDLKTNTSAFEKGAKSLADVGKKAVGLKGDFKSMAQDIIGMTMKMGAAFLGLGAAMAKLGLSTSAKLSDLKSGGILAGGMNPLTFKLWTDAAKVAGASAEGFADSLTTLNDALQDLKAGDASKLEAMSKAWALAFGNSNFKAILDMSPEDRIKKIMTDLEGAKDKQQAYNVLRSAGLGGIADADIQARARNTSILKQFQFAQGSNMVTGSDIQTASRVDLLKNQVGQDFTNLFDKIGAEVAKGLEGPLKGILDWFANNKKSLEEFAKALGQLTTTIFDFAGKVAKLIFGDEGTLQGRHTASLFQDSEKVKRNMEAKAAVSAAFSSLKKTDFAKLDPYAIEEAMLKQMNDMTRQNLSGSPMLPWQVKTGDTFKDLFKNLSPEQLKTALNTVQVTAGSKGEGGRMTFNLTIGDQTKSLEVNAAWAAQLVKSLPGGISQTDKQILLQSLGATQ
jgi:hypothetical protein